MSDPLSRPVLAVGAAVVITVGYAVALTASIDAGSCARIAELVAEVKTDKLTAGRKLDVTRAMCP